MKKGHLIAKSLLAGVILLIVLVVLFLPMVSLIIFVGNMYETLFSSTASDTLSYLTIFALPFLVIGLVARGFLQKRYPIANPYATLFFPLPLVLMLYFMFFMEVGNATAYEILLAAVIVISPALAYAAGLFIASYIHPQKTLS